MNFFPPACIMVEIYLKMSIFSKFWILKIPVCLGYVLDIIYFKPLLLLSLMIFSLNNWLFSSMILLFCWLMGFTGVARNIMYGNELKISECFFLETSPYPIFQKNNNSQDSLFLHYYIAVYHQLEIYSFYCLHMLLSDYHLLLLLDFLLLFLKKSHQEKRLLVRKYSF